MGIIENWHLLQSHCRHFEKTFIEMFLELSSISDKNFCPLLSFTGCHGNKNAKKKINRKKYLALTSSAPPPAHLTKTKEEEMKKKSWIWILCHSLIVHNFTGIPSSSPTPTPPFKKQIFLELDSLSKFLLESLKLELYDFRSYSLMIICFWKYGLYEMC